MISTRVIILCDGNVKWKFGIFRIVINLVTFRNTTYHVYVYWVINSKIDTKVKYRF